MSTNFSTRSRNYFIPFSGVYLTPVVTPWLSFMIHRSSVFSCQQNHAAVLLPNGDLTASARSCLGGSGLQGLFGWVFFGAREAIVVHLGVLEQAGAAQLAGDFRTFLMKNAAEVGFCPADRESSPLNRISMVTQNPQISGFGYFTTRSLFRLLFGNHDLLSS